MMKPALATSLFCVLASAACSEPQRDATIAQTETRASPLSKGGLAHPTRRNFVGFFNKTTATWTLRMKRPGWTADTAPDMSFAYGNQNDVPIVGDWDGNGTETQGVFRAGTWLLSNTLGSSTSDVPAFGFGNPTDVPIVGDWDGNGTATPGIQRGNTFCLRNSNTSGNADFCFGFGNPGDIPLAGDWDGDGIDTVGVYRASTSTVYLTNDPHPVGGAVTDVTNKFGNPGAQPVVGDWDGDGVTSYGVRIGVDWYLGNDLHTSIGDVYVPSFGGAADVPVSGNFNVNAPSGYSAAPASLSNMFLLGVYELAHGAFSTWKGRGVNTVVGGPPGEDLGMWTTTADGLGLKMIRDPGESFGCVLTNPPSNPPIGCPSPNVIGWLIQDEPDVAPWRTRPPSCRGSTLDTTTSGMGTPGRMASTGCKAARCRSSWTSRATMSTTRWSTSIRTSSTPAPGSAITRARTRRAIPRSSDLATGSRTTSIR